MNRIDRITAILIQLQSRKIVKAQDIADRFNISLRTVYRDIRCLEEAGIPIISEAGVGYSIMDGYRLPPVMFTKDEATAFITAEKLIEKMVDSVSEENYKSAMYKIRAVLKSAEKEHIETLENHIEVLENPYLPSGKTKMDPIPTILNAISTKHILSIQYFANHSQEQTKRWIEPVGIFYLANHWHLIAYCHLRKDYRDFRVDRIFSIQITDDKIKQQHPALKSFLKKISKEQELITVMMLVDKQVMRYLGEQKYYNGFISQREVKGRIEMTFLTSSLEGIARWYMMLGDYAEIIQPEELKIRIREISDQIHRKLN